MRASERKARDERIEHMAAQGLNAVLIAERLRANHAVIAKALSRLGWVWVSASGLHGDKNGQWSKR